MFALPNSPRLPRRLMAIARLLDRQLATSRRIRAIINDPDGRLSRLLPLYETYLQNKIHTRGGAIICTRKPIPVAFYCHGSRNITRHPFRNHIPAGTEPSPWHSIPRIAAAPALRNASRIGSPRCVTSIHILDAHRTGRLTHAMRALIPLLPSNSGALIIAGNATRNPRTPFARLWRQLHATRNPHYLLIDLPTLTLSLPRPKRPAPKRRPLLDIPPRRPRHTPSPAPPLATPEPSFTTHQFLAIAGSHPAGHPQTTGASFLPHFQPAPTTILNSTPAPAKFWGNHPQTFVTLHRRKRQRRGLHRRTEVRPE